MPHSTARLPHELDYIERTIATVRNHRDADNCWPQWANIFADQIEALTVLLREAREHYEDLDNPSIAVEDKEASWHDLGAILGAEPSR